MSSFVLFSICETYSTLSTLNQNGYQLKLPLNIDCIIPKDDSVRLLSQFVEELDISDLYSTYQRIPENLSPRTILKVVL